MSAFRPLPSRPNLEFEHKEAKALLRRMHDGDAEALARARDRHPAIDAAAPERIKLADAQLVIAREYGFTSWPKLVRYFEDVERLGFNDPQLQDRAFYESSVRWLIQQHQSRRGFAARHLAAYVPRFYGMRSDAVYASAITEDDARLATARSNGSPSWEALLEKAARNPTPVDGGLELTPLQRAGKAMRAADLDALRAIVAEHAGLLDTAYVSPRWTNLMRMALHRERTLGPETMRPILDWLTDQGFDVQRELNIMLTGRMKMETDTVRWLLDHGADPDWVAPNGVPVLEHALIRYWNGKAVDLIAARATPRKALWIAAGLGDIDGVRGFLDAKGKPTPAAYALRPPLDAVGGPGAGSQHPEPDEEEILVEAFAIAMTNGRTKVLEYMASHGTPVNSLIYMSPLINPAIGNNWPDVVETLVRGGADLDVRGWHPDVTPREAAREMLEMFPHEPGRRRIAIACGLDPDSILAELATKPVPPPGVHPDLRSAMELAGDDAARLGQSDIGPENVLFGMLRSNGQGQMYFTRVSGMDLERFVADFKDRLLPREDRIACEPLPLRADSQDLMRMAIASATERRREVVNSTNLLYAMTKSGQGVAAELLARYGGDVGLMNERLLPGL
jgi:hypothetical protein